MTNIIIIFILLMGIYSGGRRGLVLQGVHFIGLIVSYIVAFQFYTVLSKIIETVIPFPSNTNPSQLSLVNLMTNLNVDKTFYNVTAFILILIAGWIVTRIIAVSVKPLMKIPVIQQLNWIGGAVLGLIGNWIGIFIVLTFLSFIPMQAVQSIFQQGSLATVIATQTPILSDMLLKAVLAFTK